MAINTYPLHRRTVVPVIRMGFKASALTEDTTTAAVMSRVTKITAVVANAAIAWAVETVRECAARPASNGPVQPNPASRYPKP